MDPRAEDPEERAAARETARLLERAVNGLPALYRSAYVLREIEQLSTAETAESLGLSEEAVKVRLHRARAMLRDALGEAIGRAAPDAFQFLAPRCNRMVARVMAEILAFGPLASWRRGGAPRATRIVSSRRPSPVASTVRSVPGAICAAGPSPAGVTGQSTVAPVVPASGSGAASARALRPSSHAPGPGAVQRAGVNAPRRERDAREPRSGDLRA